MSNQPSTQPEPPPLSGDEPFFRQPRYPSAPLAGDPFQYLAQPRVRFQHKWWKHILLFCLTAITTTLVGAERYAGFLSDFGRATVSMDLPHLLVRGLWYSGTILAVLGAHEMGHYVACRRYQVDATLPYFIPIYFPIGGFQIGTLGAVIRIREAFPNRKILFDVGIAGPIAGFVVLVPLLFIGMYMSQITVAPPTEGLIVLGKPLLFRVVRWLVFGPIPAGSYVNLHPIVFAAWFGMLATALNLLPFGQLDGGHVTYAALGRWSTPISLATIAGAAIMSYLSASWRAMTVLMFVMLILFGPRHPPVLNEYDRLDRFRYALALFALVMLVLCFTPFPLQF